MSATNLMVATSAVRDALRALASEPAPVGVDFCDNLTALVAELQELVDALALRELGGVSRPPPARDLGGSSPSAVNRAASADDAGEEE